MAVTTMTGKRDSHSEWKDSCLQPEQGKQDKAGIPELRSSIGSKPLTCGQEHGDSEGEEYRTQKLSDSKDGI